MDFNNSFNNNFMDILNIIAIILWLFIGSVVLFLQDEITKFDYLCAWIVLIAGLISNLLK